MLGRCELDLVHMWPKFWHGVDFRRPPSMAACNKGVHPHPATCSLSRSLSAMQRMFLTSSTITRSVLSRCPSVSSLSLVWLGPASLYPINTIRQLFTDRGATPAQSDRAHWDTSPRCQHSARVEDFLAPVPPFSHAHQRMPPSHSDGDGRCQAAHR